MITSTYNQYKVTAHMSQALLEEAEERRGKYIIDMTEEMMRNMDQDPDFFASPIPEKYTSKDLPPEVMLNYFLVQMQPVSQTEDQFIN